MKQFQVMSILRKYPNSPLWNYVVSKWTPEQISIFNNLKNGKLTIETKKEVILKNKKIAKNAVKIIRISDGKIYNSISECKENEGLHDVAIRTKLKEGIEFKRF